uniref:Uncharacterized protein n=1 Tax=Oryza meridionalis TaxID=40149 RepID=A0A0E0CL41_9ORYZ
MDRRRACPVRGGELPPDHSSLTPPQGLARDSLVHPAPDLEAMARVGVEKDCCGTSGAHIISESHPP